MRNYLINHNMKKNIYKIGIAAAACVPFVAFAAQKTLGDIINIIIGYFTSFITLIIGLAVLTFMWNVYRYFFTEKDKKEAGLYVMYSVIGFFVILSLWGLVNILTNTFNLDKTVPGWPFTTGGSSGTPDNLFNPNQNTGGSSATNGATKPEVTPANFNGIKAGSSLINEGQ